MMCVVKARNWLNPIAEYGAPLSTIGPRLSLPVMRMASDREMNDSGSVAMFNAMEVFHDFQHYHVAADGSKDADWHLSRHG